VESYLKMTGNHSGTSERDQSITGNAAVKKVHLPELFRVRSVPGRENGRPTFQHELE
jgi:hypothetical protein